MKLKKLLLLVGTFTAGLLASVVQGEVLDTTLFNRTCPFTFASYRGASTLENFPVAVRLSQNITGFLYSDCAANGADIRFTDDSGNLLPHEIETWNTSGESIVWVRLPALTGTATRIRIYFGQKADTTLPTVNPRDVWTKYVTVVHGGAGLSDSSPKQVAVANGGGVSATMSSGIIGGGVNKPARDTIGVNVANPFENNYFTDKTKFTLSAWYKFTGTSTDCIASSKGAWGGTGFLLLCEGGSYMSCAVQSKHQGASGKGKLVQNQWNHVGFSYVTTGQLNTYFDGVKIYTNNSAKSLGDEGKNSWTFGGYAMTSNGGNHGGDMDEMRIFDGIASDDWMQAEYDSIKVTDYAAPGAVLDISAGRIPNAVKVTSVCHTAAGIVISGEVAQLCEGAASLSIALKWGETEALAGGTVAVPGTFAEGDAFTVTLPATSIGTTYHYRLELTPDVGKSDVTVASSEFFVGAGATWRPQSADATWSSAVWQVGGQLYELASNWSALFDGDESPYLATIQLPGTVSADVVTFGGTKDYTLGGTGALAANKIVKSGTGTMSADVTRFAEPVNLEVTQGQFNLPGNVYYGRTPVGTSRVTVGGGDEAASVIFNHSDATFGYGPGADVVVTVRTNGLLRNNAAQWTRFGVQVGAHCVLEVERGGEVNGDYVLMGSQAATCEARVAGTITVRSNYLGVGEGSNTSLTLLPGGIIRARGTCAWNNNASWNGYTGKQTIHVNDGTFELYPVANYGTGTPILNTVAQVTYENAITFDIPGKGVTCCKAAITNVTAAGTARFIKTGTGELNYLADAGGISGRVEVREGLLTFGSNFVSDDVEIQVGEGGAIGYDAVGGWTNVLKHLDKNCAGTLVLYGNNKTETIDLSEYPNLKVLFTMADFQGTIITADNHLVVDTAGRSVQLKNVFADVAGHPAKLTVRDSLGGGMLYMVSSNPTMTGGITVKDGVRLILYGPSGNAYAAGASGPVKLESGTSLQLDASGLDADFVKNRVTDDSDPAYIFLQSYAAACNVDVSRFPDCRVGIAGNTSCTQTGTITPAGDTYLFGGGDTQHGSSYSGLCPGVLTDGETPRSVVVDRPGMVNLSNSANTYSGGTVVTNGARVYVAGGDGFGKVPETFDADNIFINGAVLRSGCGDATLAVTRGLWVGDLGMTLHPWSGYTFTLPGGLGGTGDISVTDGGNLAFTGAYNTWNGHLNFQYNSNLTIGNSANFSWASTGGIQMGNASSVLTLKTDKDDSTFNDTISGAAQVRKEGSGQLTMSKASQSTGRTTVAGGTLRLVNEAKLTANASVVNNGEIFVDRAGTATDIFAQVPITGTGVIRFRDSQDTTIDRSLFGLQEVEVASDHTKTFKVPAPDTAISLADGATLKLAASSVTGFTDFTFSGTATRLADNLIQVTPAEGTKAGSAYWNQPIDVTRPWEARFTYQTLNPPSNPADGICMVVQRKAVNALGATGGAIGIQNITPSFGIAFNIYSTDTIGWIENGNKTGMNSSINGLDLVKGVDVVVTYDGVGEMKAVITQGDKSFTQTKSVSLVDYLGGYSAWFGFAGATGGAYCDQRISNFRLTQNCQPLAQDFTVVNDSTRWKCNWSAGYVNRDGTPAFRLTDAVNYHTGSVVRASWLHTDRAFKVRGKYIAPWTATPADGMAIFLQNNGLTATGNYGGGVGVQGLSTAIGWKLNLYNSSKIVVVKNGNFGAETTALNGIDFRNKQEVDFTFAYRPGTLSLTVAQGDKTVTVTQAVNLMEYFGQDRMYFAISGGTGGLNTEQYVYGLSMEYDTEAMAEDALGVGYGSISCEGTTTVKVPANAGATSEVGTLTLGGGATLKLEAEGANNTAYAFAAQQVVFDGEASVRLIDLKANGNAKGTLCLGTVVYDTTRKGDVLKVVGALAPLNGKITVRVPKITSRIPLMDLTEATGVTIDDFVLDTDQSVGRRLRIVNGILTAVTPGTMIIIM